MSNQRGTTSAWRGVRWCVERLLTPLLFFLAGVAVIAAAGLAQRAGWISRGMPIAASSAAPDANEFTCPMHPQIRQPTPGRCPICGMQLVTAGATGSADLDEFSSKIEPAQRRLANIETHEVQLGPIQDVVKTIGTIAIDESRMATIASYFDGRIEKLFADYTGVTVDESEHLAVVYSGELYSAQVEYLQAREAVLTSNSSIPAVSQANKKLVTNARRNLEELGLQEARILELEAEGQANSRQTIYAPIGGTVIEKLAVEGKYVKAGEPIYRIADLGTVWLKLELYPEDASRIRFGQLVEARLSSLPGETLSGRVAFIDPIVNERTRTVGVRVEFANEEGKLRPGDYADASIKIPIGQQGEVYDAELAGKWISPMHPQIIRDTPGDCPICGMSLVSTSRYGFAESPVAPPSVVWVPRSAVLMAGENSVAYVEIEDGRFQLRKLTLGPILRDKIVIIDGVEAGERVATAGNFLIDSQMQLAGKPSLIDPLGAAKSRERNTPLELTTIHVNQIAGEMGTQIEELFSAYFDVHRSLANDESPTASEAAALHQGSISLMNDSVLSANAKTHLLQIAKHSEHLHHLGIDEARLNAFRPISHAIIRLAAQVRGDSATSEFHQMYCPMVAGGAGDWLQPNAMLRNPYFGTQMLECGNVVRAFPTNGHATTLATDPDSTRQEMTHSHDHGGH